jgi:hypothetical protein
MNVGGHSNLSGRSEAVGFRKCAAGLKKLVHRKSLEPAMSVSDHSFEAWYEAGADGHSKIVVVGKVTEIDGSVSGLVRAVPQGMGPHTLLLKIKRKPYEGKFHPHITFEREIRYEEPAQPGAFADVKIQSNDNAFMLKPK